MNIGRPTLYTDEVLAKTKKYLEVYETLEDVIPSIEGLSEYIGIARPTIYKWSKEEGKEDFIDTLEAINAKQKKVLLSKGLTNDFNANIVKLALGNHGMSEKIHNEMSAPGGGPIQTTTSINFIPVSRKKVEG